MTMTRTLTALVVLCLICSAIAAQDNSRQNVERTFKRFITAFNNLDWDTFRGALADDVTLFNPDIPEAPNLERLDGRHRVEESFKAVFGASRRQSSGPPYLHIVPKNVRIQMLGKSAIVTFEFDRDGNSFGRRTLVFHRELRGWKIVHIHASNAIRR
jgi:ketosteroid isomerase-like protein